MTSTTARGETAERVCAQTGLVLVPYPSDGTWRVYKEVWGPLKGKPRTSDSAPSEWNRFDLPDQATLYSATSRKGAYAEALAPLRPRLPMLNQLAAEVFDDVEDGDNPIRDEWCERDHMLPGTVAQIWRTERRIAQITVEDDGWYIDIEHPKSLQVLRTAFAEPLQTHGHTDMDVSVIRGNDRQLTCAIAEWVAARYLDDGSVPLGICYTSRLGSEWQCWATFPETKTRAHTPSVLELNTDIDLEEIARLFELRLR